MKLEESIENIELDSFKLLAKRYGTSIDNLINKLIEHINDEISIFNTSKNEFNCPLKTKKDYWDFVHRGYEMGKAIAIELICNHLDQNIEEFDFNSIYKMSRALNISKKEMDFPTNFSKRFMGKIPVVVLFDLEFNANTSCGFIFDNVPVIRHFDFLHNNLLNLLNTVCLLAYEERTINNQTGIQYRAGFTNFSSKYFKFAVEQVDKLLLALASSAYIKDKLDIEITLLTEPEGKNLYIKFLSSSFYQIASTFVWIHEFAHILYGDIMKNYWYKEMESRCDKLATECLFNTDKYDKSYTLIAIDSLFILLRLLVQIDENVKKSPNNKSSSFINDRGKTVHDYIFNRLTKQEQKRYNYHSYLIEPLIQAA